MRKFQEYFNNLAWFRSYARQTAVTRSIKMIVGDSTNNNRTLTVGQAIRYFKRVGRTTDATKLEAVKAILEPVVLKQRRKEGNRRTDAVDLSELVTAYRVVVMEGKKLRRQIGTAVSKVG